MKIAELVNTYCTGFSGTGNKQVLSVTLIDTYTGEILFQKMRAEGFLKLINPHLDVESWGVVVGKPHKITNHGNERQSIILEIYASVMDLIPPYYSDAEWEAIKAGTFDEEEHESNW